MSEFYDADITHLSFPKMLFFLRYFFFRTSCRFAEHASKSVLDKLPSRTIRTSCFNSIFTQLLHHNYLTISTISRPPQLKSPSSIRSIQEPCHFISRVTCTHTPSSFLAFSSFLSLSLRATYIPCLNPCPKQPIRRPVLLHAKRDHSTIRH